MDIIFMGTPDFAVPVLETLIASEKHMVKAVVTQPDKARGRSGKLIFTPVKEVAVKHEIPVYTPQKVKDPEFVDTLKQISCDIIVVVAFGQILSKEILGFPKFGCVNVHASLLPRWRGAAPIQWSILEGDERTGVTIMQMDVGLDTGDMIASVTVELDAQETGGSLFDKLQDAGAQLCVETMKSIEDGTAVYTPQDNEIATHTKMIQKSLGKINWSLSAVQIERLIRGLNPWPSAYTYLSGKTLKIWKATVHPGNTDAAPGTVVKADKQSLVIQTGVDRLSLEEVQLEGKKRMPVADFLRGFTIENGTVLGTKQQ